MRLIDADELRKVLKAALLQSVFSDDDEDEKLAIRLGEMFVREVVNGLPTIDAAPVVRCKDCIHAIKFRSGQVSCGYHDWCRVQVDPDGYCNHGEKDDIDNTIAQGGGDLIDMMEEDDDENADGHLGVDR